MILFETSELKYLPETLKSFIQKEYQIYYNIDDPSEMFRFLFVEVIFKGETVANADFQANDGEGHCQNIIVKEKYRRKGIATAIYVFAEFMLECVLENFWGIDPKQTETAKKLWAQSNRPFGNRANEFN